MDNLGTLTSGQNAALIFAFLQADSLELGYNEELLSLGTCLNIAFDGKLNEPRIEHVDDGDLECDGHLCSSLSLSFNDIQPSVELQHPRDLPDAAALQQVAQGLREIAAQMEHMVVARAITNLNSNISSSPIEHWKHHLANEVEKAMRRGLGLDHLPQERVIMAFTLTLVKGVCERAPRALSSLFSAVLQYISPVKDS